MSEMKDASCLDHAAGPGRLGWAGSRTTRRQFAIACGAAALSAGAMGLAGLSPAADVVPPKPKPKRNAAVVAAVEAMTFDAAKPAKPRKLLIYSHCNGYSHGPGIAALATALEAMGRKTGAFECVISDDLANFEADAIGQFDAIFFNNASGQKFVGKAFEQSANPLPKDQQAEATARLRKNLVEFVKGGKGIAGNHGAADGWPHDAREDWKEWCEMIGGNLIGHNWEKVAVTNDDPGNPVNAAFDGKDFEISEEIYMFGPHNPKAGKKWDPYGRDVNRVLLSVDVAKSGITTGPRADNDYGLSWIKNYGKGRTFYCAFGHHVEVFTNPPVLKHFLAGVQFVLGDLKAEAKPRGK
ncbi:MAG: ThuA domain-containing protein [Thermoguttaceae bacterium]|jgi:hypothetical protein